MQPDRIEVARAWLRAADSDLDVADTVAQRHPNIACFHAQQASEKCLKGTLVALCGDQPRAHLAQPMVAELHALGVHPPPDVESAAVSLDLFYIPTRYPDALGGANPSSAFRERDAVDAIERAKLVLAYCSRVVESAR